MCKERVCYPGGQWLLGRGGPVPLRVSQGFRVTAGAELQGLRPRSWFTETSLAWWWPALKASMPWCIHVWLLTYRQRWSKWNIEARYLAGSRVTLPLSPVCLCTFLRHACVFSPPPRKKEKKKVNYLDSCFAKELNNNFAWRLEAENKTFVLGDFYLLYKGVNAIDSMNG